MPILRTYSVLFRAYWAIALEYRAALIVWTITNVAPMFMVMSAWLTLIEDGNIPNMTKGDFVIYYIGLSFVRRLTGVWIIWDIDREIRHGLLSPKLLKPLHPIHFEFARTFASKPLEVIVLSPLIIGALLFFPSIAFSTSWVTLFSFVCSVLLALLIEFYIQWNIGLLSIWITQATSVYNLWMIGRFLFGGYALPIYLFPQKVFELIQWLPFRYVLSFPVEIITGQTEGINIFQGILIQLYWLAILVLISYLIWKKGSRYYSAVGA